MTPPDDTTVSATSITTGTAPGATTAPAAPDASPAENLWACAFVLTMLVATFATFAGPTGVIVALCATPLAAFAGWRSGCLREDESTIEEQVPPLG